MRIVHVCMDFPPRRTRYGSGTVNDDLLSALHRDGHDVVVVTPGRIERGAAAMADGLRLVEVPTDLTRQYLLPANRPGEMFATPADVEAWNMAASSWLPTGWPLPGWRSDVVHNDGWSTHPLARALAARFDCPLVTTAHVVDRHYTTVPGRRLRPAEKEFRAAEEACFDASDLIVVPSTTAHDLAAHYFPSAAEKLRIVPHGLSWKALDRFVRDLGRDESGFVTVHYLGRISSERGWRRFLDAFVPAATHAPRLRLRVIGDGTGLAEARHRYRHPAITFLGPLTRPQVVNELRRGDIFCNPALIETFGVAELEAMALGRCTVSNSGFGKHTHVEHLHTGVRIPIAQRDGLPVLDQFLWTSRLVQLAADAELRTRLGAAARRVARTQYTIDRMSVDMLTVFSEAIDEIPTRTGLLTPKGAPRS